MLRYIFISRVYYLVITMYFVVYLISNWTKLTRKKRILTVLLYALLIIVFSAASFTLNASAINKAFESDTLIIESEKTYIRIDSKEIFNDEYGVMMNKESIIKNIQIMQQEAYANLKFYKDEKLVIVLKIYEVDEKSGYSRNFLDKHIEVKWNGYQLKLSNEFYKNIKPYLVNSVYLYSF